jgi:hypothetical protein
MSYRSRYTVAMLTVLGLVLAYAGPALAIPAFARQNKAECSTCHTIYPALNEFGEAFMKNSYVWPGKPKTTEGGNTERTNEAMILSGIPELIPVSFKASLNAAYDSSQKNKFDLATRSLQLQAGGTFREAAGFFITYNAYTEGPVNSSNTGDKPSNNSPDIQELFVQWRHALGTPLNLKAGRFEPTLGLWKTSNRLTIAELATQLYRVGDSPFAVGDTQDALELNSMIGPRVFAAMGIVNRKNQNTKDGYGHLSCRIGGTDFLGHEPEVDLEKDSIWDYLTLTVGGFGYFGRNTLDTAPATLNNDYFRAGIDADLLYKRFRLRFSGVRGRDNAPNYTTRNIANSLVMLGEAQYLFGSPVNLIGLFRYEYEDNATGINRTYVPSLVFAPIQNIKLTLEYQHRDKPVDADRIGLAGASFSF